VPFDVELCLEYARQLQPALTTFRVSALTGEGIEAWCRWIMGAVEVERTAPPPPAKAS
jgi:hydrogenase nickel incorporation protein HypB